MPYYKVVGRSDMGLLSFRFMAPKWRPTVQNHAVTGLVGLIVGLKKTPISRGFAGRVD